MSVWYIGKKNVFNNTYVFIYAPTIYSHSRHKAGASE